MEAETTWMLALSNSQPEEIEEFILILQTESERQKNLLNYQRAELL